MNIEHSFADPTCDNKKAYECKHCHKRYNCKITMKEHLLSKHKQEIQNTKSTGLKRTSNQNDINGPTSSKVRRKKSFLNATCNSESENDHNIQDDTISIDPVVVRHGSVVHTRPFDTLTKMPV